MRTASTSATPGAARYATTAPPARIHATAAAARTLAPDEGSDDHAGPLDRLLGLDLAVRYNWADRNVAKNARRADQGRNT
jgi:hypothetical protein